MSRLPEIRRKSAFDLVLSRRNVPIELRFVMIEGFFPFLPRVGGNLLNVDMLTDIWTQGNDEFRFTNEIRCNCKYVLHLGMLVRPSKKQITIQVCKIMSTCTSLTDRNECNGDCGSGQNLLTSCEEMIIVDISMYANIHLESTIPNALEVYHLIIRWYHTAVTYVLRGKNI